MRCTRLSCRPNSGLERISCACWRTSPAGGAPSLTAMREPFGEVELEVEALDADADVEVHERRCGTDERNGDQTTRGAAHGIDDPTEGEELEHQSEPGQREGQRARYHRDQQRRTKRRAVASPRHPP